MEQSLRLPVLALGRGRTRNFPPSIIQISWLLPDRSRSPSFMPDRFSEVAVLYFMVKATVQQVLIYQLI